MEPHIVGMPVDVGLGVANTDAIGNWRCGVMVVVWSVVTTIDHSAIINSGYHVEVAIMLQTWNRGAYPTILKHTARNLEKD